MFPLPRSALLACALLATAACAGHEKAAQRPEFASKRAWSHLTSQVSFGPRYAGDPRTGHDRQLQWMRRYFSLRADTVIEQTFTRTTPQGKELKFTNLLVRFRPDAKERILLASHWDTRPYADRATDPEERQHPVPGANEGASGTAVLMELAAGFAQQPPPMGVDLLLTDADYFAGGDTALAGTRYFVSHLPPGYTPKYAVVLGTVGDADARFVPEGNAQEAAAHLWKVAAELGEDSVFVQDSAPRGVPDPGAPLQAAGIPTVVVTDRQYGPGDAYRGTQRDELSHVSRETLDAVGEALAELIYRGG